MIDFSTSSTLKHEDLGSTDAAVANKTSLLPALGELFPGSKSSGAEGSFYAAKSGRGGRKKDLLVEKGRRSKQTTSRTKS